MKANWLKAFSGEIAWWRSLTGREKLYTVYFLLSFTLLVGMADCNPVWVMFLAVLNFGNSARLVKKVPIDKLEEEYYGNEKGI
mgnify:FL=1|jgi:hypothetical protein